MQVVGKYTDPCWETSKQLLESQISPFAERTPYRKEYPDAIGWVCDFRKIGKRYQIPYSALYNEQFDNLLAAGRIISAPSGDGWEVARVIPCCTVTGQAAGAAAAIAALEDIPVNLVNTEKIGINIWLRKISAQIWW